MHWLLKPDSFVRSTTFCWYRHLVECLWIWVQVNLKFNTSTVRTSVRNTVPEVYTKAIFPDLLTAVDDLPETGRVTGGVTKTAARLFLAKAYLTYGWWLENPNNIPTYPQVTALTLTDIMPSGIFRKHTMWQLLVLIMRDFFWLTGNIL